MNTMNIKHLLTSKHVENEAFVKTRQYYSTNWVTQYSDITKDNKLHCALHYNVAECFTNSQKTTPRES